MFRIWFTAIMLLASFSPSHASEFESPKDVKERLTLTASDYTANMDAWHPLTGQALLNFVGHKVWGGLYFEKDPLLGQVSGQAFIILVDGDRIRSQSEADPYPSRGELDVENDKYCVYWKGYGKLCYRVLVQTINGKAAYLITRENGKVAAGVEFLQE